jgi:hypothetical protein
MNSVLARYLQVEIDAFGQALGALLALVPSQLNGHPGRCFQL